MYPVAVLAGGLGLRLRELTGTQLPKAMVPVLGRPFVDWQLETLAASGVTEVVLLVGHSGDHIRDHVGSGHQFGLAVTYVEDGPTLRGTGGAILHALPALLRELLGDLRRHAARRRPRRRRSRRSTAPDVARS